MMRALISAARLPRAPSLVDDHGPMRRAHAIVMIVASSSGRRHAQIHHLGIDAFGGEHVGGVQRLRTAFRRRR